MVGIGRNYEVPIKFFRKILENKHHQKPRAITTNKNVACFISIKVIETFRRTEYQQIRYLNNIIEDYGL